MYNTPMMDLNQPEDSDDPEIGELKAWLSRASGECLAYLKGATEALLFVQENHGFPSDFDTLGFEKRGAGLGL